MTRHPYYRLTITRPYGNAHRYQYGYNPASAAKHLHKWRTEHHPGSPWVLHVLSEQTGWEQVDAGQPTKEEQ